MGLAPLTELLSAARAGGYAVGYFEAWDSYSLEAVVEAAETERAPVVLGFGCLLVDQLWLDNGGIETLGCLGRHVAKRTTVPVSLLLNEAHTLEHGLRGIEAGFNAVMLCTSDVPTVAELVRVAHGRGVAVEGELDSLPDGGADGEVDTSGARLTDPEQAAAFVADTGIDCLAVSFGNVHTLEGQTASVDLDHLAAIGRQVEVPLVVHGGTSFPPDAVAGAVACGAAKFNVGTVLKRTFAEGLTRAVVSAPLDASPHAMLGSHGRDDLLASAKPGLVEVIRDLIRLYGGSGRADA
jgi:fructose/tagatose bisphosphate aldolase